MSGKVLVVDSIARTGASLTHAVNYLEENNKLAAIASSTIISTVDDSKQPIYKDLSHYAFYTKNKLLKLPWSEFTPETEINYQQERKNKLHRKKQEFKKIEHHSVLELEEKVFETLNAA